MHNNILNIVKKELDRFFKDKRMVLTTIIMPAILIYALYSIIGAGITSSETVEEGYKAKCYIQNVPQSFANAFDAVNFELIETDNVEESKKVIENKEADLLIVFPDNFDALIMSDDVFIPEIVVFYNSTSKESSATYATFLELADQFESSIANVFDVNRSIQNPDLSTETERVSTLVASILPMLIIMLLFTGCMAVAPESIAGEKERGTIATLLVTPVNRTDIAIGKTISLSIVALLAGISSFIGVMLALPKMFANELDSFNMSSLYGIKDYACLLLVIASTVLLIVSITSVLSAYSKSVKEATSMTSPLMMISTLTGIIPMFSADFSHFSWRLIPIFNSVLSLNDIFSLNYSPLNIVVTCISNVAYMLVFVVLLSKMFNSEKIMFKI